MFLFVFNLHINFIVILVSNYDIDINIHSFMETYELKFIES